VNLENKNIPMVSHKNEIKSHNNEIKARNNEIKSVHVHGSVLKGPFMTFLVTFVNVRCKILL
jgi:hypothetical protein